MKKRTAWNKIGLRINCVVCGKEFPTMPCLIKVGNKYCSRQCYAVSEIGRVPPNKVGIVKNCLFCNKEFSTIASKIRVGKGKYCSLKCHHADRKGVSNWKLKGKHSKTQKENHPRWKGGRGTLMEQIRKSLEYKMWRTFIFIRDDRTCVLCKYTGKKINVDHYPVAFSQILDIYKIKTLEEALECDLLWNVDNGRTLCIPCHTKTETYPKGFASYYGQKGA